MELYLNLLPQIPSKNKNAFQKIALLTRTPKQRKLKQSSLNTLSEAFGETQPNDIWHPSERNDYLDPSIRKDRVNRQEDLAAAARVMAEIGEISRKGTAIEHNKNIQLDCQSASPNSPPYQTTPPCAPPYFV